MIVCNKCCSCLLDGGVSIADMGLSRFFIQLTVYSTETAGFAEVQPFWVLFGPTFWAKHSGPLFVVFY